MQKFKLLSPLILSTLFLVSCQSQINKTEQSSTEISSTEVSTTVNTQESIPEAKSYEDIITNYSKVLTGTEPDKMNLNVSSRQAYSGGEVEARFSGISYSLYDLNNDGSPELLIALKDNNNSYTLLDIYSNSSGKLVRLTKKGNHLEQIGHQRTTLTIRQDNSLFLSTPINKEFILYKVNKDATDLEKISETNKLEEALKFPKEFDLPELQWKPVSDSPTISKEKNDKISMDLDAIKNGDFSSIAGTWKNGYGIILTFDKNGLVSDTEKLGTPRVERDLFTIGVSTGTSGYSIMLLPAGKKFTMGPGEDPSNQSVDRIWAGQGTSGDPREFFYKVN